MTTLSKISSIDSEFDVNDVTVKMTYEFTNADKGEGGWINGRATVGDKTINVGGGWVDEDGGDIDSYAWDDAGDVELLIEAVGLDSENEDDRDAVWKVLVADCPREWPHEDYEILAEHEEEFTTTKIVRIGDDLYSIDENGGSRGAHQNRRNNVESIDEREAKRLMLQMGMDAKDISRKFRSRLLGHSIK